MTYDEYFELKNKSDKVGLNMSDYMRSLISGHEPKEKPPKDFYEAIKQIRAVGNNINQLTRLANATGIVDELSCKKQFDNLNQLVLDIKKQYLLPDKRD